MTAPTGDAHDLAYLALGANLGEPLATLRSARRQIAALGEVVRTSSLYRTEPVGGPPGQPAYLNAALAVRLHPHLREPFALLEACMRIERQHGRERRERWSARTLDVDVLDLGGRCFEAPELHLPHPRMLDRAFVLAPLCEVAPDWRHPRTGVSACVRLAELDRSGVERTQLGWEPR